MPKPTKIILIASAFCLVSGLVLGCIGAAFGGIRVVSIGWDHGLRVLDPEDFIREEESLDISKPINQLSLDVSACELTIKEGVKFNVTVYYSKVYWSYKYSLDDTKGALDISLSASLGTPIEFGFYFASPNERIAQLVITIPRSTTFSEADITCNAASVDLSGLKADKLSLYLNACSFYGKAIACQELVLHMNAGYMQLDDIVAADSASISLNAGDLNINDSSFSNLGFDMQAGAAYYQGKLGGVNDFGITAGYLEIELKQAEDDIDFRYEVGLGDLSINDRSFTGMSSGGNAGSRNADVRVSINVEFGSVNVTTR
ncbi:MAG: DUF4097 domain-containing protein [Coriobacteriia bacterium]|nr:DUF4097 domain-containing protein [Coriobacteriia bacterium]